MAKRGPRRSGPRAEETGGDTSSMMTSAGGGAGMMSMMKSMSKKQCREAQGMKDAVHKSKARAAMAEP